MTLASLDDTLDDSSRNSSSDDEDSSSAPLSQPKELGKGLVFTFAWPTATCAPVADTTQLIITIVAKMRVIRTKV